MSQMMDVFEAGEQFLTMARDGSVRVWGVSSDGTVAEVAPPDDHHRH